MVVWLNSLHGGMAQLTTWRYDSTHYTAVWLSSLYGGMAQLTTWRYGSAQYMTVWLSSLYGCIAQLTTWRYDSTHYMTVWLNSLYGCIAQLTTSQKGWADRLILILEALMLSSVVEIFIQFLHIINCNILHIDHCSHIWCQLQNHIFIVYMAIFSVMS